MEVAAQRQGRLEAALIRVAALDLGRVYLVVGSIAVFLLSFLSPPFMPPDENRHFYRAWQLSELDFKGVVKADSAGAMLPSALVDFVERYEAMGTDFFPFARHAQLDASRDIDPRDRVYAKFSESSSYPPLAYAPQIAAIGVARLLGLRPLPALYLTRLCNGVCALLIAFCALRILPAGRLALFIASLLPMTLFIFASASADATMISVVFLFTAIAARAGLRGRWTSREAAIACVAGAVFCTLKPPYAPLLLLGLPAALKPGAARHILRVHALLVVTAVGVAALWWKVLAAGALAHYPGVDAAANFEALISRPLHFVSVALHTVWTYNGAWLLLGVGVNGNSTIFLPPVMYLLPFLALASALAAPPPDEPVAGDVDIVWRLALMCGCVTLVIAAMFVVITPAGQEAVVGVQGRYFIPFAALVATFASVVSPAGAPARSGVWRAAFFGAVILIVLSFCVLQLSVTGFAVNRTTAGFIVYPAIGGALMALLLARPAPGALRSVLPALALGLAIAEALLTPLTIAAFYQTL